MPAKAGIILDSGFRRNDGQQRVQLHPMSEDSHMIVEKRGLARGSLPARELEEHI